MNDVNAPYGLDAVSCIAASLGESSSIEIFRDVLIPVVVRSF